MTDGFVEFSYVTFQASQFDEVLQNIDISIEDNPITSPTDHILLYQAPFYFYPVFEIVHYLITAAKIRSDYGLEFGRRSPLLSLLSVVVSCVAGSVLTNLVLGLPLASAFKSEANLVLMTLVWLAVFHCPGDLLHPLVTHPALLPLLWSVKEQTCKRCLTMIRMDSIKYKQ